METKPAGEKKPVSKVEAKSVKSEDKKVIPTLIKTKVPTGSCDEPIKPKVAESPKIKVVEVKPKTAPARMKPQLISIPPQKPPVSNIPPRIPKP